MKSALTNDVVSKTHSFGSSERVVEGDVIEHSDNLEVKIRKTEFPSLLLSQSLANKNKLSHPKARQSGRELVIKAGTEQPLDLPGPDDERILFGRGSTQTCPHLGSAEKSVQ